MRFSVGYNPGGEGDERFPDIVSDYLPDVAEVYFAWGGAPSGRAPLARAGSEDERELLALQAEDLRALRGMGVRLNLLFNANCYGGRAVSADFERELDATLDAVGGKLGGPVEAVTTASPFVARAAKRHAPDTEVRASVNLRLGTARAMEQVADLFDAYCVQRDVQRDLGRMRRLRAWADAQPQAAEPAGQQRLPGLVCGPDVP